MHCSASPRHNPLAIGPTMHMLHMSGVRHVIDDLIDSHHDEA
jgi:hypothetical protein